MKKNFSIPARRRGFTLLEVMIAAAIFFIGMFGILALVSQVLGNARRLDRPQVDASPVLALYAATNSYVEGNYSGELSDIMGESYRGYRWASEIIEVATNHLYSVRVIVQPDGNKENISDMTSLFFGPNSPPGSLDGGNFTHRPK